MQSGHSVPHSEMESTATWNNPASSRSRMETHRPAFVHVLDRIIARTNLDVRMGSANGGQVPLYPSPVFFCSSSRSCWACENE